MQIWGSREVFEEDQKNIAEAECIAWERLRDKCILITGATGLIGMTLVRGIMAYNEMRRGNILVLAHVRSREKAQALFGGYIVKGWIKPVVGDILQKIDVEDKIDYIIHGASETSSRAFVEKPVETILTAVEGSNHLLELARRHRVESMVYMSSMEVYGTPDDSMVLTEERMGYLNPTAVRSSYPESKRMVENLCAAYASEYGVSVKIVRLTQTFGPGVSVDDGRVFAEFARCAVRGENICLQTKGETKRMYLYTADAATAILTVLTKGQSGEAYNAANPATYCSIREMAEMVAAEFGGEGCRVVIAISANQNSCYNPTQAIYMDVAKLNRLGWYAQKGLREIYRRMISS